MTPRSKIDDLIAARLPDDLRPTPVLRWAGDETECDDSPIVDERLLADLEWLERRQNDQESRARLEESLNRCAAAWNELVAQHQQLVEYREQLLAWRQHAGDSLAQRQQRLDQQKAAIREVARRLEAVWRAVAPGGEAPALERLLAGLDVAEPPPGAASPRDAPPFGPNAIEPAGTYGRSLRDIMETRGAPRAIVRQAAARGATPLQETRYSLSDTTAMPSRFVPTHRIVGGCLLIALLASAIGLLWPTARWATVEIHAALDKARGDESLLVLEAGLWDPSVVADAAHRAGTTAGALFSRVAAGEVKSEVDRNDRTLRLIVPVESSETDAAGRLATAWAEAFLVRCTELARGPSPEELDAMRARRDELASAAEKLDKAVQEAQAELDADASDAELRRLIATQEDAAGLFRRRQAEARLAARELESLNLQTEEDAVRVMDAARLEAARQADGLLQTDIEQLAHETDQAAAELDRVVARVAPLAADHVARIETADRKTEELLRKADESDAAARLDRIRRTLAAHRASVERFASDWQAAWASVSAARGPDRAATLIRQQQRLVQLLGAASSAAAERLAALQGECEAIAGGGVEDLTRRMVLQAALNQVINPLHTSWREVAQAAANADGAVNAALDSLASTIRTLSARVTDRTADIALIVADEMRAEWRATRGARLAAARNALELAVRRREEAADAWSVVQEQVNDLMSRIKRLDAQREELRLRREESQRIAGEIAAIDRRIAEGGRPDRAMFASVACSPTYIDGPPFTLRAWRALQGGGAAAALCVIGLWIAPAVDRRRTARKSAA